jgi:hypothetical protein
VLFQFCVFLNPRKKLRKCLILYYETSGITCILKHLIIFEKIEEEINNLMRGNVNRYILLGKE